MYLHHLEETGGLDNSPPFVDRALKSKACRSAIMFGDSLSQKECAELVERLRQTRACFSCAHGRPTMVPLVNLRSLKREILGRMQQVAMWGLPARDTTLDVLLGQLEH